MSNDINKQSDGEKIAMIFRAEDTQNDSDAISNILRFVANENTKIEINPKINEWHPDRIVFLIGPKWLDSRDSDDRQRNIDIETDYVRRAIEFGQSEVDPKIWTAC